MSVGGGGGGGLYPALLAGIKQKSDLTGTVRQKHGK